MLADVWLQGPPPGTEVCGGFDGSDVSDWTAIKLETRDGFVFTPRFGPDERPTIWNPAEHGGRIPREQVDVAWEQIAGRYTLVRVYYDPGFRDESSWESAGEAWDQRYGPKVFASWQMAGNSRVNAVYAAMRRFEADLVSGVISHDGCPVTTTHMGHARRIPKPADRYGIGKPSQDQKIDAAVTTLLAHEAACDARAAGWSARVPTMVYTSSSTRRRR